MLKNIFTLISLTVSFTAAYANVEKYWEHKRDSGLTKTWKLKKHKKTYVSKTVSESDKKIKSKLQEDKYYQTLIADKQRMLTFVGVEDWTIEKKSWSFNKDKNLKILHVEGNYHDSDGVKTYFIEKHIFYKFKVVQLLYVKPYEQNIMNDYFEEFYKDQVAKI